MSNNLDFLSIRSLNGLGFVSANDIENIGDLSIDGDLTVSGDITSANSKISFAADSGAGAVNLGETVSILGGTNCSTSYSSGTLTINSTATDTTALEAWRTDFNNTTAGKILLKGASDDDFAELQDDSSSWNLTSLWRDTFNSNVSTNELLYKSGTDTIDGLAWDNSSTSAADNSLTVLVMNM